MLDARYSIRPSSPERRYNRPASDCEHRGSRIGWEGGNSGREIACAQGIPVLSSLSHCLLVEVRSLSGVKTGVGKLLA
jgi:hypothetical protein